MSRKTLFLSSFSRTWFGDISVLSDIRKIIEDRSSSLSPRLKLAAGYVARHPMEVSYRPLRQIAQAAELAPPTFSRLARSLGFADYEEMREACRHVAQSHYLSYSSRAAALRDEANGSPVPHATRFGIQSLNNLEKTILGIEDAVIAEIVDRLLEADNILVNAQMGLSHIAAYWVYVASLGFDNWQRLGANSVAVASQLRALGPNDCVISIGFAPYATRTVELARLASEQGAQHICITDNALSPLIELSDTPVIVADESMHYFGSQISLTYTIETIMGLMVTNSGNDVQDKLNRSESLSEQSGDYLVR